MIRTPSRLLQINLLVLILLTLSACQTIPNHKVHHQVVDEQPELLTRKEKVLLLPPYVKVMEFTAGGLTNEVKAWTDEARDNLSSLTQTPEALGLDEFEFVTMPELSDEEQALVDEYIALHQTVALNAMINLMPVNHSTWKHKALRFDYNIGPGLAFLAERTGADKAIMFIGEDTVSTGGRKAMFIFAAALGVGIPMGHSLMAGSILDLRSGNILWLNHDLNFASGSLQMKSYLNASLTRLFERYPGIEEYQTFVNNNSSVK